MIRLKAIRGKQGNLDYFVTTATYGEVARIVNYKEQVKGWPPALQQQRPLNMSRVRNDMVPYLIENEDHFYNALVVEHVRPGDTQHDVKFVPDQDDPTCGWVELAGSEQLEALDGQHRLKSIELAVAEQPDLAKETIAMVIVPHRRVDDSQQLFSDLNRNAKPTPKSLNILFEHREEAALLSKALAQKSKYLAGRVNLTGSNLSARSPYLVTISTLYEAVRIMKGILAGDFDAKEAKLVEYWDAALGSLPGMSALDSGQLSPAEIRNTYIYSTGLGFEALGDTINVAVTTHPAKWRELLTEGLPRIPWELAQTQIWEGVALFAGRIAIARAARRRTATLVKYLLGLPVEDRDLEELKEEVYKPLNRKLPSPVLVPEAV